MHRRSKAVAVASALLGLLLQLVLVASAAHARPAAPHAELKPQRPVDATLAPPVKRNADVVKPERPLRMPVERHATAVRADVIAHAPYAAPAPGVAPPRARSHAQRLRVRPPDDPPQSAASA